MGHRIEMIFCPMEYQWIPVFPHLGLYSSDGVFGCRMTLKHLLILAEKRWIQTQGPSDFGCTSSPAMGWGTRVIWPRPPRPPMAASCWSDVDITSNHCFCNTNCDSVCPDCVWTRCPKTWEFSEVENHGISTQINDVQNRSMTVNTRRWYRTQNSFRFEKYIFLPRSVSQNRCWNRLGTSIR